MILCEERLLNEETIIFRHQKIDKEDLILVSLSHLRRKLDEVTEKGGVMTEMGKDLFDPEEAGIRREAMMMRLGICGTVVGRGGAGMRKGGDAAAELAALEFETH